jgi:hypothetical protein
MSERPAQTTLSDGDVLAAWEQAEGRPPAWRAPAILADDGAEDLATRPIGMLDADLLALHAGTFGARLEAIESCPACGETLELSLRADDLRASHAEPGVVHELEHEGYRVRFRAATPADLGAAGTVPSLDDAQAVILARCVVAAEREGVPLEAAGLPDALVEALSARMAATDPQADLRLSLTCPECEHGWQAVLDLADFVWRELESRALRLFGDVAMLAAAYGWDEDSILTMSPARRRVYTDLLAG